MAQHDRYSNPRERGRREGRPFGERNRDEQNWYQGKDFDQDEDNPQWGRHQPREGGEFEERYSGRGGSESRGNEPGQRGQWREHSYGRGPYEREDHLRSGGSYGGRYEEDEGSSDRDWERSQFGGSSYFGGEQRGYGEGRRQDFGRERGGYSGSGSYGQSGQRGSRGWGDEREYGQSYGSQDQESGTSRYGSDYSMTGTGLRSQWDRGFSDMSRGTSGAYGQSAYGQSAGSSGSGAVYQPQRQSFRGRGPKGYERSDERLKELICERLMDDPDIDASEISVEVRNREVTLEGTVDDRRVKYEVEELVERCGGVKDVKNQLRVRARGSESGVERSSASTLTSPESTYGTSGRSGISGGTSSSTSSTSSTTSSPGSSSRNR